MSESNTKYEELLSKYIDGELGPLEKTALQQALDNSSELRSLHADLLKLKDDMQLESTPAPADLKNRIAMSVQARYGEKRTKSRFLFGLAQYFSNWNFHSNWRYVTAAMATVTLPFIIYISVNYWSADNSSATLVADNEDQVSIEIALDEILAAQDHYIQAINNLENLAAEKLDRLPDNIASVYSENLEIINRAIAECENSIGTNTINSQAYASLSHAYQAKIDLLMRILET